jgi:outer membrane protein assembly factor BamB
MRRIPADVIAEVGTDRIVAAGCGNVLTLLDRLSGDVVWQQVDAALVSCGTGGIAVDDAGSIYTLAERANAFRTLKHAATGALAWNVDSDAADGSIVSIVGVSDGLLYVRAQDQLHALHTGDGSQAWSADIGFPTAVLLAGSPAEAIVVTSDTVSRLAEDT